jgi:hypothetical protein
MTPQNKKIQRKSVQKQSPPNKVHTKLCDTVHKPPSKEQLEVKDQLAFTEQDLCYIEYNGKKNRKL